MGSCRTETFNTDIKERHRNKWENDADFLHLAHLTGKWCAHTGNVRSDACTRKKCACVRVPVRCSVYTLRRRVQGVASD